MLEKGKIGVDAIKRVYSKVLKKRIEKNFLTANLNPNH
jgi:hypothetical protein